MLIYPELYTLGYGYCLPFGYAEPVKVGNTMFGTRLSFRTRNAKRSPSGDHQCATCVCRISSEFVAMVIGNLVFYNRFSYLLCMRSHTGVKHKHLSITSLIMSHHH